MKVAHLVLNFRYKVGKEIWVWLPVFLRIWKGEIRNVRNNNQKLKHGGKELK